MNPNYSRDNSIQKRKEKTGAKAGHAAGFLAVKVFFVCFLAVVIVGGCAGAGILKGLVDSAPDISNLSVTPSETATYIYDQNGTAMQKLTLASSNRRQRRNPSQTPMKPTSSRHAVKAFLDKSILSLVDLRVFAWPAFGVIAKEGARLCYPSFASAANALFPSQPLFQGQSNPRSTFRTYRAIGEWTRGILNGSSGTFVYQSC